MHSHGLTRLRALVLAIVTALLGMVALASCSTPLAAINPTATPTTDAATILQKAAKANYQDVTFALTFSVTDSATDSGQTFNGTGTGALTKNPERTQFSLSFPLTILGQTENLTIDIITDAGTNTTYTRVGGIAGVPATWTKSDTSVTSVSPVDVTGVTDLTTYTNAKLVGSETLNGVAVWHIQASPPADTSVPTPTTTPAQSTATDSTPTTATSNFDIYIRQDNYYPLKLTGQMTGATAVDMTINFTKYNSGVTITLPAV